MTRIAYRTRIWTLLLLTLLLAGTTAAQNTTNGLPQCAVNCMNQWVPLSGCSLSNQMCICTNSSLQTRLAHCIRSTCTPKDGLTTQRISATACGMPYRDSSRFLQTVSIPLFIIATLFVAARITARLPTLGGKFGPDDYCIVMSWLLSVGFTTNLIMLRDAGLGIDVWNLPFKKITVILERFWILEKLYIVGGFLIKISILCMYLRIFPDEAFRRVAKVVLVLCSAAGFCLFWAALFKCWPIAFAWEYWDGEHNGTCSSIIGQAWANSFLNMFFDVVILFMPLPTIWRLNLSLKKRLGIMLMFSVGLSITIVTLYRIKTMLNLSSWNDITWDLVQLALWFLIDIYCGIICACLPGARNFYIRFVLGKLFGKQTPSSGGHSALQASSGASDQPFRPRNRVGIKGESILMPTEAGTRNNSIMIGHEIQHRVADVETITEEKSPVTDL